MIKVEVLGSGTSTGVPLIHCDCRVCRSKDPKNKRLRASIWINVDGKSLLIDTSTDLRQQALRSRIPRIDAVLYTHPHADHILGIDEIRSFNFIQKESIPAYGNEWTRDELFKRFSYIFKPGRVEGGGIPQIEFHTIDQPFSFEGIRISPIKLMHGSKEVLAYRIGSVAYVTDCSYIPEDRLDQLQGLSVLILDCLRIREHPTHLNLEQALEVIGRVKPKKSFLTHLGHDFDYKTWKRKLPKGVSLAYDGLKISVPS